MNTIKLDKGKVKLIAHRGLSGIEVENTKEAFIAAANRSYYGIETDISVTKDSKIIIFHDSDLKRLGNLDKKIEDTNSLDIVNVNLIHKNNYTISGNYPLYFEDYLAIIERYQTCPIIELKYGFNFSNLLLVLALLKKYNMYEKATIISFNFEYLKIIRKNDKTIKLQLLLSKFENVSLKELQELNISIDINYQAITKELIDRIHSLGLEVNVWTVDDFKTANKLIESQVDYITSNILE